VLDRDPAEQDASAPEFPPSFGALEAARERYLRSMRVQSEMHLAERAIREVFQPAPAYRGPGVDS
jgi:hypothetical protein